MSKEKEIWKDKEGLTSGVVDRNAHINRVKGALWAIEWMERYNK